MRCLIQNCLCARVSPIQFYVVLFTQNNNISQKLTTFTWHTWILFQNLLPVESKTRSVRQGVNNFGIQRAWEESILEFLKARGDWNVHAAHGKVRICDHERTLTDTKRTLTVIRLLSILTPKKICSKHFDKTFKLFLHAFEWFWYQCVCTGVHSKNCWGHTAIRMVSTSVLDILVRKETQNRHKSDTNGYPFIIHSNAKKKSVQL